MQKSFLSVKSLCVSAFAGISAACFFTSQPSLAQLSTVDSSPGGGLDNTNPFSGNSGSFNPIDLIHRAQLGTAEWNAQQKGEELDSAVADLNRKRSNLNQTTNNIPVNNTSGQAVPGLPTITYPVQIIPPQN